MMHTLKKLDQRFLLTPKILYFFINLQYFTVYFFRANFANEKFGITEGNYAIIAGVCLFITFFSNIAIATYSDRLNQQRSCFFIMMFINAVIFQLFFHIGTSNFFFWILFTIYAITNSSVLPILDKLTIEYLGRMPNVGADTYGRQRLWGTIAYVVTTFVVEKLICSRDPATKKKMFNFENLRIYNFATSAIAIILITVLIKVAGRAPSRRDIFSSWKSLLKNGQYLFFIFIILMNGITRGSMTLYLSTYLSDVVQLKKFGSDSSIPNVFVWFLNILINSPAGTVAFFGVLLEMVLLYNAKYITKKVGLYWPLLLAQVAQLIRFIGYRVLEHDTTYVMPIISFLELFKGLNFGLTHLSAVQIATSLCPPHLKTTSQTIYSGTFVGLSSVISGFTFGTIIGDMKNIDIEKKIERYKTMFNLNAAITFLCILFFLVKYGFIDNALSLTGNQVVREKVVEENSSSEEINLKANNEIIEKDALLNEDE